MGQYRHSSNSGLFLCHLGEAVGGFKPLFPLPSFPPDSALLPDQQDVELAAALRSDAVNMSLRCSQSFWEYTPRKSGTWNPDFVAPVSPKGVDHYCSPDFLRVPAEVGTASATTTAAAKPRPGKIAPGKIRFGRSAALSPSPPDSSKSLTLNLVAPAQIPGPGSPDKACHARKSKEKKVADIKSGFHSQQQQVDRLLRQLLCGGFAGVVSRSAVAPLDLIKTHLMTGDGAAKSAVGVFLDIVKRDSWRGLFRGNAINCIRVAPNKAIELCVFESVRRVLNKEGNPFQNFAAMIAGGAAGIAGTIATYPLELIRTRISIQPELYSNLFHAIGRISKEEGIGAFYSGLTPSVIGVFPYAATNYFVYDRLCTTYRRSTRKKTIPVLPTLLFGAIAAAASSAVTFPLDVARKKMQLSVAPGILVEKSAISVIREIYMSRGFLALYRGLGTTWLKLVPAAGISFMCYEAAKIALLIDESSLLRSQQSPQGDNAEEI